MADVAAPLPPSPASARADRRAWLLPLGMSAAVVVAAGAVKAIDPTRIPELQNFLIVAGSLLVGAVPLIGLGALVSALIEVLVPDGVIGRIGKLPERLQLPVAGLAGFAFPVCECGSVPVARRLAGKGLTPGAAVAFMLAAPILNPIVIVSTVIAYRGRDTLFPILGGRIALGFAAAVIAGWVVGGRADALTSATPRRRRHAHDHHAGRSRGAAFFEHFTGDFVFMGRYLVLGAAVAAALQTFLPQSILESVATTPVLNLVAMMGLAFVLSLCSESDAFVAASFVQFGPAAQLAFLVFGPLVDTKLAFLYSATFNPRLFRTIAIVVAIVTLTGTLWMEVLFG